VEYNLALLLLFIGGGLTFFSFYFSYVYYQNRQLKAFIAKPFDTSSIEILSKIPHYSKLPSDDKLQIHNDMKYFIFSTKFIGIEIKITEEMRLLIAFYACLLLLHVRYIKHYDALKIIIIYPRAVMYKHIQNNGGIYSEHEFAIEGQSANDTVVLSWDEVKKEAYHLHTDNVVVHEFAHEIDFMDTQVDGVPPMIQSKYKEWIDVLYKEYAKLNHALIDADEYSKYKLIGEYASTNEAEFFAVISERFFESPKALHDKFPKLYTQLQDFYQIDTMALLEG